MVEPILHQSVLPTAGEAAPSAPSPKPKRPDSVALRRLLAVATLTPAQAALLAEDLVAELIALHSADRSPSTISDRWLHLTTDGRLTVAAGNSDVIPVQGSSVVAEAAALVRRLAENAQGGRTSDRARAAQLTAQVSAPVDGFGALRERVYAGVAAILGDEANERRDRARRELAALVAATRGEPRTTQAVTTAPATTTGQAATGQAATGQVAIAERPQPPAAAVSFAPLAMPRHVRTWHHRSRRPSRKIILITVATVLVAALVWWGVPQAWTELRRGWQAMFTTEEPSRDLTPLSPDLTPARAPDSPRKAHGKEPREPREVTLPAPKAAGPVQSVTLEAAEGPCLPGESCAVRVDVRFTPSQAPRSIGWRLLVINRCTGKTTRHNGLTLTAEPGWQQVYGISSPDLPKSKALAIMAVTRTPAKAASEPLYLPGPDATC